MYRWYLSVCIEQNFAQIQATEITYLTFLIFDVKVFLSLFPFDRKKVLVSQRVIKFGLLILIHLNFTE